MHFRVDGAIGQFPARIPPTGQTARDLVRESPCQKESAKGTHLPASRAGNSTAALSNPGFLRGHGGGHPIPPDAHPGLPPRECAGQRLPVLRLHLFTRSDD
jgi:hypothetical protein